MGGTTLYETASTTTTQGGQPTAANTGDSNYPGSVGDGSVDGSGSENGAVVLIIDGSATTFSYTGADQYKVIT